VKQDLRQSTFYHAVGVLEGKERKSQSLRILQNILSQISSLHKNKHLMLIAHIQRIYRGEDHSWYFVTHPYCDDKLIPHTSACTFTTSRDFIQAKVNNEINGYPQTSPVTYIFLHNFGVQIILFKWKLQKMVEGKNM